MNCSKTIKGLLVLFTAWSLAVPGPAQEEESTKSKAKRALQSRLEALETESKSLEQAAGKLEKGEAVEVGELNKSWLPPAVSLVDVAEAKDTLEITDAAALVASELLKKKEDEIAAYLALKARIEAGEEIDISEVEDPAALGARGRLKALEENRQDVGTLRERLEELQFEERFRRASNLNKGFDDEEDPAAGKPGKVEAAVKKTTSPTADETVKASPVVQGPSDPREEIEEEEIPSEEVTFDPRIAVDYLALAKASYRAGRYKRAWDILERIDVASHENGDWVLYLIGRCREKVGDLEGALESYGEVAKRYPPESFWVKEAGFAMSVVEWKIDLGPISGTPAEVYEFLHRQQTVKTSEEETAE